MNKDILKALNFLPKENTSGIFVKKYGDGYSIEVDFEKELINYGNKIKSESKTTSNFSQAENWVVLECVDRLLVKGYKPEDITLEKVFPSGHGHSGRLDIFVEKEKKSFLMIECKTYGREFDKEYKNIQKDGGQLFTYFQNDKNTDFLMLYASQFNEHTKSIEYKNEIVVIEDAHKETANVKDFFDRWNKFTKNNGIFENGIFAYKFESKSLRLVDIKNIQQEDSSFIFNRFIEILRHNAVSDKPNAFNKIFTLFLCKVKDEDRNSDEELDFQWKEGEDDNVSFQKRLSDLYKKAMKEFLDKEVSDFSDADFDKQYKHLSNLDKKNLLDEITKLRLQKNNEFAIKDVFDEETFIENGAVLKEVVELLQNYRFRYNKKQPFLGDFFELLLNTGLKQESGQFFTPVPIARFICRSVPLKESIENKLNNSETDELLPNIIDYAAGSGHFLTEAMEEMQGIIESLDFSKLSPKTQKQISNWKTDQFSWAYNYVYGIERDYRLVKTTKVGCYLHGDGVANIIHADGLDSFDSSKYPHKLNKRNNNTKDNAMFDFVLSNPPYSVSSFKGNTEASSESSDLYPFITDSSSEIECLFIERTKQLLKDGGIASVILPSTILSNAGTYIKSRELILQYFDIVGIAELGKGTFMATDTTTVTLFLRRRNEYEFLNIKNSLNNFLSNMQDVTLYGLEKPVHRYIKHVWKDIDFSSYITLIKSNPDQYILKHGIYTEYKNKIKAKSEKDLFTQIIEKELEKILYFIIASQQKVVLIKSGEKAAEKKFLGYEFSNRRGSEGIHPIQRGKSIDECTQLFDSESFYNPSKASTYILKAFEGDSDFPIDESMKNNVSRHDLVEMLTFDRVDFEKSISLSLKKKIKIESQYDSIRIGDVLSEQPKSKISVGMAKDIEYGEYPFYTSGEAILSFNNFLVKGDNIFLSTGGNSIIKFFAGPAAYSTDTFVVRSKDESKLKTKLIFYFLDSIVSKINELYFKGVGLKHLQKPEFRNIEIPIPPLGTQQKIISEIEVLEYKDKKIREEIESLKNGIEINFKKSIFNKYPKTKIGKFAETSSGGTPLRAKSKYYENPTIPWLNSGEVRQGNIYHSENYISELGLKESNAKLFPINSVLVAMYGATGGQVGILRFEASTNQAICGIFPNEKYVTEFLYYHLKFQYEDLLSTRTGVARDNLSQDKLRNFEIFLPPLDIQQKEVFEIEKIEVKIKVLETEIAEIPKQKEAILKRYL